MNYKKIKVNQCDLDQKNLDTDFKEDFSKSRKSSKLLTKIMKDINKVKYN